MIVDNIIKELNKYSSPKKARILSRFFKTGKGEYGQGDLFIGVTVPNIRLIAKKYRDIQIFKLQKLIKSKIHEQRLTALLILTYAFLKADSFKKEKIINFYIKNIKFVNNWDLVDLSAPNILGNFLLNDSKKSILYKFAKSDNLWEKRISIISTFSFIKRGEFKTTLEICEILLYDKHDLIHKACGWMLREIGKRDIKTETDFLLKYSKFMPRTMLRYSIERFNKLDRDFFLKK